MHKLGISVYPEKEEPQEMYAYMREAAQLGYSRIFTCFLSVQESKEEMVKKFTEFMREAHRLGFEVAVDTNGQVFRKLQATCNDLSVFSQMGVDILRLDESFGTAGDVAITHNPYGIKIEFNGSVDQGVNTLIACGALAEQMTICHNFYPERYSGLAFSHFQALNKHWKSLHLRTAAFVSSNQKHTHGPWNVFCGLPSVEDMRNLPIDLQARYYLWSRNVDDLIIGNAFASHDELVSLSQVKWQRLQLTLCEAPGLSLAEKEILYTHHNHQNRLDYSDYFIRSSEVRTHYTNASIPARNQAKEVFHKGDVLIVNDHLAHYRGELEIALKDIPNDGERNYVGSIVPEEIGLLDLLAPGEFFEFRKKNK